MTVGMWIVPIGLIIFGWTAEKQVHWIVPLIGATIYAIGTLMTYICIQNYLVDAFEQYSASALAATVVLRSIIACVLSTVGFQLYQRLGYAWYA